MKARTLHPALGRLAVLLALACAIGAPASAAPPRHVVKDPYYGDCLFYFFQQRYF